MFYLYHKLNWKIIAIRTLWLRRFMVPNPPPHPQFMYAVMGRVLSNRGSIICQSQHNRINSERYWHKSEVINNTTHYLGKTYRKVTYLLVSLEKDLINKEIVDFSSGKMVFLDPVFRLWLLASF